MRSHLGIGSVDLRIIETGLDDGRLRIVRHKKLGNAAERLEGAHMRVDPIKQRLRPSRQKIRGSALASNSRWVAGRPAPRSGDDPASCGDRSIG